MSKYIKVEDAIGAAINGCASWDGGYYPSMDDSVKEEFDAVADKCIELVRCKDFKHWDKWVCDKDGGHECIYNGGVWMEDEFCSDGERKDGAV